MTKNQHLNRNDNNTTTHPQDLPRQLDPTTNNQKRKILRLYIIQIQPLLLPLAHFLLQLLLLKIYRRPNQPLLPPKKRHIQRDRLPPCPIEEKTAKQTTRSPQNQIRIKRKNLNDLRRPHQNKRGRQRKDTSGDKRLHRLVPGKNPRQSILLDKRPYRLVEKTFHHAQLQSNAEQSAGDEGAVLGEIVVADDGAGGSLEEAVEGVGGGADGFEGVGVEVTGGEGDGFGGVGGLGGEEEGGQGGGCWGDGVVVAGGMIGSRFEFQRVPGVAVTKRVEG
mmetsp:Transcript_12968/g.25359  ORF Transcript_12968/g.25359 Transcript_12968/m.25359 type:complete len:277 (+) Transcript_12968:1266-2096(+)